MTDAEFAEQVRIEAGKLAGIFAAINTEVAPGTLAFDMARNGGLAALALSSLAAKRNITAGLAVEQREVEASGYDLAALATAPPARVEE